MSSHIVTTPHRLSSPANYIDEACKAFVHGEYKRSQAAASIAHALLLEGKEKNRLEGEGHVFPS